MTGFVQAYAPKAVFIAATVAVAAIASELVLRAAGKVATYAPAKINDLAVAVRDSKYVKPCYDFVNSYRTGMSATRLSLLGLTLLAAAGATSHFFGVYPAVGNLANRAVVSLSSAFSQLRVRVGF